MSYLHMYILASILLFIPCSYAVETKDQTLMEMLYRHIARTPELRHAYKKEFAPYGLCARTNNADVEYIVSVLQHPNIRRAIDYPATHHKRTKEGYSCSSGTTDKEYLVSFLHPGIAPVIMRDQLKYYFMAGTFNHDASHIALATDKGKVQIIDPTDGRILHQIDIFRGVENIAYSADSKHIIVVTANTVGIIDVQEAKYIALYDQQQVFPQTLNATTIVEKCDQGMSILNVNTDGLSRHEVLTDIQIQEHASFISPNKSWLLKILNNEFSQLYRILADKVIPEWTLSNNFDSNTFATFSGDSNYVAILCTSRITPPCDTNNVIIWSTDGYDYRKIGFTEIEGQEYTPVDVRSSPLYLSIDDIIRYPQYANIAAIALNNDGSQLAASLSDDSIRILNLRSPNLQTLYNLKSPSASKIVFSPDETKLMAASHTHVCIWDFNLVSKILHLFPQHKKLLYAATKRSWSKHQAHPINAENPNYLELITAVPFFKQNQHLFEPIISSSGTSSELPARLLSDFKHHCFS